jgi:putative ABC transport system substrate-binding protein
MFINVGNPIGVRLVESLSHPGGNVTGFSDMHADLSGKYVQFATELSRASATVNYLWYTEWADGQYSAGFRTGGAIPRRPSAIARNC